MPWLSLLAVFQFSVLASGLGVYVEGKKRMMNERRNIKEETKNKDAITGLQGGRMNVAESGCMKQLAILEPGEEEKRTSPKQGKLGQGEKHKHGKQTEMNVYLEGGEQQWPTFRQTSMRTLGTLNYFCKLSDAAVKWMKRQSWLHSVRSSVHGVSMDSNV